MRKYLLSLVLILAMLVAPVKVSAQTDSRSISTAGADCSTSTNCAIFGVKGYASIGVYLNVATSGTFVFEATTGDNPSTATWFGITDDIGDAADATADGALFFTNPGYSYIRLRASAISGTATVVASRGFGSMRSTASLAGAAQGDGAIQDGSNNAIEATVLDLTNGNPLTVAILDASGDQITSFGGGTQYAVDAALGATPTGTLSLAIRDDALSTLTPVEGDAIGLRVGSTGALWVTSDSLATAALQSTLNGHVDGIEALLTTIDADTGNIATSVAAIDTDTSTIITAVQLIDNLVLAEDAQHNSTDPGVQMLAVRQNSQVDLAADGDYLPLTVDDSGGLRVTIVAGAGSGGTASTDDGAFSVGSGSGTPAMGIADETAADSVDEGDVGVLRMTLARILKVTLTDETGAALTIGTDYAEDTAHTTGDAGPILLTRRADSTATTADTDGDYALLNTDASGRLWVNCGTGCSGGTQYTHDAALTVGSSVGTGLALLAKDFDGSALPNVVSAEGDAVLAAGSLYGVSYVMLVNEDGSAVGSVAQSGTWNIGTVTTVTAVTAISNALPAGNNNIGDVDILTIAAGDNNIGNVDIVSSALPTGASTSANQSTIITSVQLLDDIVGVEDAAETAGGGLSRIGSVRRDTPASSADTAGDNATVNTDANGLVWARHNDPCTALPRTTVPISVAADTAVISAGGGSTRTYICGGALVASAAEVVNIWEGTGTACGTSSAALAGSTTEANGMSLAANGGFIIPNTIRGLSTNVDICIRLSATNRVAGWLSYVQVAQ